MNAKPRPGYQACQIQSVNKISDSSSRINEPGWSFHRKVKIILKKRLGLKLVKSTKKNIDRIRSVWNKLTRNRIMAVEAVDQTPAGRLSAGDCVRVRSEKEIRATLDHRNELKGCAFIDEMAEYCGTTQQVLKKVERFVDERDYKPKKVRGIVLLDGVICNGTSYYGKCDRNCLYFWREEWLEKAL